MLIPPPQPYATSERRWIAAVLIVVALVHLGSFLYFRSLDARQPEGPRYPVTGGDPTYYARVADNLLQYRVFTDSPANLAPTNANLPAYPFFLAATKGITGSFTPFLLLQMLAVLVGIFLVHAIARRFVPWQVALVAAALYGMEPMAVFANTTLLTDGLFAALLIMLAYVGFIQDRVRGLSRAVATGFLLGVLAMLRPTGTLLIPIVLAFFALQEIMLLRTTKWLHASTRILAAFACVALVTVPWIIRNHELFGRYEIFHSGSHVMLDYDVRPFLAWRELQQQGVVSVYYPARHLQDPVFTITDARIKEAWAAITPPGQDPENYVGKLATNFMFQDPIRYAYFHAAHTPVFLFASGIAAYDQFARMELSSTGGLSESTMYKVIAALRELQQGSVTTNVFWAALILSEVAFWMAVAGFAAIGLFVARHRVSTWLFAALVAYFALVTGPVTVARYRISAEPFLLILAGIGLYAIGSRLFAAYRLRATGMSDPDLARFVRLLRYLAAGAAVFLVNLGSYTLLVRAGMWYVTATVVSFLCGFVASFVLQKFFAFRDQQGPGHGRQIGQYLLLLLFNMAANTAIIAFFVGYIGAGAIVGICASNVLIAAWNFFIYDRLLFTDRELHEPSLPSVLVGNLTDVTVIIPCHNEEESIGNVLDSIPADVGEVIVVDNNSTDKTGAVAAAKGARVIRETRRGYGAAVKAGFREAKSSVVAILDGDNQHPAGELPRILHQLESENLDFISAARFPLSENWLRGFGNWGLTLVVNVLFRISLSDSQTGMVMFRRSLLSHIEPQNDESAFVQELKIRAASAEGIRFAECRIPCLPRTAGESKLLPIRHGLKILTALLTLRARLH